MNVCAYLWCRWLFQYKPFLVGRWPLFIKDSLYQNTFVCPLWNNMSWTRNRKSQRVDGMFSKGGDPGSLERMPSAPSSGFCGHLYILCPLNDGVGGWRSQICSRSWGGPGRTWGRRRNWGSRWPSMLVSMQLYWVVWLGCPPCGADTIARQLTIRLPCFP